MESLGANRRRVTALSAFGLLPFPCYQSSLRAFMWQSVGIPMPAPARAPWVRPARMPPCFPVRAFLCALVAARFWGDPRPILHTGQLPAADPTLDGNVLGGESMAARSKTFALPWFARSDYPALLDLFSDSKPCAR